jgi:hypothetical protein
MEYLTVVAFDHRDRACRRTRRNGRAILGGDILRPGWKGQSPDYPSARQLERNEVILALGGHERDGVRTGV